MFDQHRRFVKNTFMRKMSSWGHSGRGEEGLVVVAARDEQSEYHSTSVRFYPPTNGTP